MTGRFKALPVVMAVAIVSTTLACGSSDPGPAEPLAAKKVFYLVRHAEKAEGGATSDPPLNEAGRQRAGKLARLLADVPLRAVFTTDFTRTRKTAEPVVARRRIEPKVYDPTRLEEFAAELLLLGEGSYLVVGHSNTTPRLVELLGGTPGAPIVEKDEYDRLYTLFLDEGGGVTTQVLRY